MNCTDFFPIIFDRCAACSKCFLSSNKLKYHIRRSHLPVNGSFDCTICEKECKTLRLLLNHQKSHIRIECPHCNKHFSAANYDHHIRSSHASQLPRKRKSNSKTSVAIKKAKDDARKTPNRSKTGNKLMQNPTHSTERVRYSYEQ